MEVEHLQFGEVVQILNFANLVFGHQEDLELGDLLELLDLLDLVIVEIEVEEVGERDQVLDSGDAIVLVGENFEFFFALEEGHVAEVEIVEAELFRVVAALVRAAVANPDAGNLRKFGEDDIAPIFYSANGAMFD